MDNSSIEKSLQRISAALEMANFLNMSPSQAEEYIESLEDLNKKWTK